MEDPAFVIEIRRHLALDGLSDMGDIGGVRRVGQTDGGHYKLLLRGHLPDGLLQSRDTSGIEAAEVDNPVVIAQGFHPFVFDGLETRHLRQPLSIALRRTVPATIYDQLLPHISNITIG